MYCLVLETASCCSDHSAINLYLQPLGVYGIYCLVGTCGTPFIIGITFISEPRNVRVGVGQKAHFECIYHGTHAAPIWNITYPRGTSRILSTGKLPLKHFSNATGLFIKDVDESHNMTSYSCLFQIYDRDKVKVIASTAGMLIVVETITFDLQISNYVHLVSNRTLDLVKGDIPPLLQIIKQGYSTDTYVVILSISLIHDYNNSKCSHFLNIDQ